MNVIRPARAILIVALAGALLPLFLALAGCAEDRPVSTKGPRLTEVARYGWAELADSNRPLTALERTSGAGVLGLPQDVEEGPLGEVLILDGAFHKIAVFGPGGDFRRLILGGTGEGPGEFLRPRSLSLDGDGRLWIYDQMNGRVTRFDGGEPVGQFPVPRGAIVSVVAAGGVLFGNRVSRSAVDVVIMDTLGRLVTTHAEPHSTEAEPAISRLAALGVSAAGDRALVGYHPAGMWSYLTEDIGVAPRGQPALPPSPPVEYVSAGGVHGRIDLAEPWQIGQLPTGEVLLLYGHRNEEDVLAMPTFTIITFDSAGALLGEVPTAATFGTFAVSRSGPYVYLYEATPHPQIVKYRIHLPERPA